MSEKVERCAKDTANGNLLLKRLNQTINEYMGRMMKIHEVGGGASMDYFMNCPECLHIKVIEYSHKKGCWVCLSCYYEIPDELAPPNPNEFRELMDFKRKLDLLKKMEMFEKK